MLRAFLCFCDYRKSVQYFTDLFYVCAGWFCLCVFNGVPLLTVVAKIEAQSSREFTACCNNKPSSVVSIDMGGVNKDCINM